MRVSGEVVVPGDKSISHRSLIFAALGDGTSRVRRPLRSADVLSTAGALRAMGVEIPDLLAGDEIAIVGRGRRGLRAPTTDLDCGNSGTTTRLLAGVVAGHPFAARFVGDESLSRRPMRRVARPLEAMGARVTLEGGDGLPMRVEGGDLSGVLWKSETASAQIKSAVLLAGLVAGVPVQVVEPERSRDHTERMLRGLGATVRDVSGAVTLDAVERLAPLDITVPGDPSSAAFFAALAALSSEGALRLPGVCLNPTRTGFFAALARMGARVAFEARADAAGEETGTVVVQGGPLRGTEVGGAEIPTMIDELPMLACLALYAQGETRITGARELRVKESDRIAAVVENLRALGAAADELPDGMCIEGGGGPLRGRVTTHGDHRLAMAFGVLGALPGNRIVIDDPDCVSVSYPGFWGDLRRVVG